LVTGHQTTWGAAEVPLPAPLALLEHLVEHVTEAQVIASGDIGDVLEQRRRLARHEPETVRAALAALRRGERGRRWFVLEGESKPDAVLEMTDAVLVVEGKRTERSCTSKTKWMGARSQLLRHMDAATERFPTKPVFGALLVEGDGGADSLAPSDHWLAESAAQCAPAMLDASLPHRTAKERAALASRMLGVATWQAVCADNAIPWPPAP